MPKTVTIKLHEPIDTHKGATTEVVFREPRWDDVMGTGTPYSWVPNADGKHFIVYDEPAIAHYAEACLVEPKDPLLLGQIGLADTLKIRETILDFFHHAARADAG